MSKPPSPEEIDAMLSGGHLGRPARERVLDRVLKTVEPPGTSPRRIALRAVLALGSVAAAGVVFVAAIHRPGPTTLSGDLRAKGPAPPGTPSIDLLCSSSAGVCRTGDHLFFRIDRSPARSWLAAYAERADGTPTATRIWMFPDSGQVSAEIPASSSPSILRRAIDLGADLLPGRYQVTLVLFDHPPTRDEAIDPRSGGRRIGRPLVIQ